MDIKSISGILAGLFSIICFVPYLLDVFKRKTKPHAYSWLIWSLLQAVGVAAIIVGHGGYYGVSGIAIGALFCFTIFLVSFKYGTKNVTSIDTLCLILALIAILILIFTKNALYSVILITVTDFIGFVPSIRKGYQEPYTETVSTFLIASVSNVFALIALSTYSITTLLYLCSLIFTNSLFVFILLYRRTKMPAQ